MYQMRKQDWDSADALLRNIVEVPHGVQLDPYTHRIIEHRLLRNAI